MSREFPGQSLFDLGFALSIGPQRTGTGWIERYLRWRGDVCLPSGVKEVFFFDRHYGRGPGFYRDYFSIRDEHKIVMEITTTAFDHPEAPLRVRAFFGPEARLVCPLRHPVERSFSQYQHLKRYGIVTGGISQAADQAPQILNGSRYAQHLENWYRHFPPERIAFLFQEDLEAAQDAYAQRLCEALGLSHMVPPERLAGGYNSMDAGRFPALARAYARWEARQIGLGASGLLRIADTINLRRLLSGPEVFDAQRVRMSREDHEWLSLRLVPEIERFEALLGYPVQAWRRGVQLL